MARRNSLRKRNTLRRKVSKRNRSMRKNKSLRRNKSLKKRVKSFGGAPRSGKRKSSTRGVHYSNWANDPAESTPAIQSRPVSTRVTHQRGSEFQAHVLKFVTKYTEDELLNIANYNGIGGVFESGQEIAVALVDAGLRV